MDFKAARVCQSCHDSIALGQYKYKYIALCSTAPTSGHVSSLTVSHRLQLLTSRHICSTHRRRLQCTSSWIPLPLLLLLYQLLLAAATRQRDPVPQECWEMRQVRRHVDMSSTFASLCVSYQLLHIPSVWPRVCSASRLLNLTSAQPHVCSISRLLNLTSTQPHFIIL